MTTTTAAVPPVAASPFGTRPPANPDFGEYVASRRTALLRAAYAMTGDQHQAEDLLQTALVKTMVAWPRIREPHAADAYVRRVMSNQTVSWSRQRWRSQEQPTDRLPEPRRAPAAEVNPLDSALSSDQRAQLWNIVQTLPAKQRAAVVLRYYEDMGEADVARVLGCSVGTVKSNASRGIAALRERLAGA